MEADVISAAADYKPRRQTLTIMELMQSRDVDASLKNIDRTVLLLKDDINDALVEISQLVKMKYKECIPSICATNTLLEKVHQANENLKKVEESLSKVISSIEEGISDEDRLVFSRAKELKQCLEKLSLVEKIETDFSALWCSESTEMPLRYARLIAGVQENLRSLSESKSDIDETFAEKIAPLLREEFATLRGGICYQLNQYWDKLFVFTTRSEEFIMKISLESKPQLEEHFEAMNVIQTLDGRLAKLSQTLMKNFCYAFIRKPSTDFKRTEMFGVSRPVSQSLRTFFDSLADDLGDMKVGRDFFIALLYEKMSSDLMSMLLQDCITKAIPIGPNDEARFEQLKSLMKEFLHRLQERGYIPNAEENYKLFVEELDIVFNSRHCTKIIVDARTLISTPYLELETVGYGQVDEVETAGEIKAECDQTKKRVLNRDNFPRLLRFAKCQVSKSTVQFIELIKSAVMSAAKIDSESAAGRLLQTARNAVQLFICIAPRYHQTQISSVPQIAAVFYNNCYYICHCLMTMPVDVSEEVSTALRRKHLAITFVDFLPALRQLAADALEKHLVQCRRQIATILSDRQVFVNLDDVRNFKTCEGTLESCSLYLIQIANVWRGVFSNTVFGKALGNLVAFLFNSIIKIIFANEDIKAYDAETSAKLIIRTVTAMEKLFEFGEPGCSSIHQFAEREYFCLKEVIFCLQASLQEIFDRWCSGKGPLAQWLKPKELSHLVVALFQESEKRDYVLKSIG
ncbi:unnamed protein product [Enterobius vermicularis]|uniref:Conserved oligomeric Golgi complex subunit 7 n=1 Tax=Enterobius vermicularis TaxID=51028 RepID=A0A0N4V682_ENTVE|nr:unnamed protein product [Enterobius vermicularis]